MPANRKRKTIGILTFHRAINYGALLQAYGLQEALRDYGMDTKVIDYRCPFVEKAYRLLWGLNKKKLRSWKYTLKGVPHVKKKTEMFRKFEERYLELSKPYNKGDEAKMEADFDEIITGSDQVWNMDISGNDRNYLLDKLNDSKMKNSYAVSLGTYKLKKEDVAAISKFDKISLREKSAADYVKELTGRDDVHCDIDPTLLLTPDKWEELVNKNRVIKEKYIFIYSVHPENHMVSYAKELAKEKNLKIVHLHNRVKMDLREPGVDILHAVTPNEFLTLIHDAEYVITNSFHGTVFSIIYRKQFLSELTTKGGFNNRVYDLLTALNINRRILEPVRNVNDGITIDEEINFDGAMEALAALRAESIRYLESIVEK
ncbi:MAG: polysaccharide pyruvyl transferase family protein [Lachnospiraceae bacterium]|nr:polysaccharide pyruvyl transferase family protein [Lachnospiraceae bacterium]